MQIRSGYITTTSDIFPNRKDNQPNQHEDSLTASVKNIVTSVPVEIVTVWAAIMGILETTGMSQTAFLGLFIVALFVTPGWHYITIKDDPELERWPAVWQCVASSLAFTVWAYYLLSIQATEVVTIIPTDATLASAAMLLFPVAVPVLPLYAGLLYRGGRNLRRQEVEKTDESTPATPEAVGHTDEPRITP